MSQGNKTSVKLIKPPAAKTADVPLEIELVARLISLCRDVVKRLLETVTPVIRN